MQRVKKMKWKQKKSPAGKAMLKLADAKFYENKVTAKNATAFPVR